MWPYPWTHVGTPSHLGHMDRVAATMPSQAHAGAAQEAPDIGQWEGQDVPLVRPSSCNVKGGIPSSRRYLPTYLPPKNLVYWKTRSGEFSFCGKRESENSRFVGIQNRRNLVLWESRMRVFSFFRNRKSANSCFVKNENPRILVLWKTIILVLWKKRIGEFLFFGKRESQNSRLVGLENRRILVLRKMRDREFWFY